MITFFHGSDYLVEFVEDEHIYICNGVMIPSVTQIIDTLYPERYANINESRLQAAAERGSAVHSVIEQYVKKIDSTPLTDELRGFRFLEKNYKFTPLSSEVPLLYVEGDTPVFAGRMDLLIEEGGQKMIADIKTTSVLDREYLKLQLNLYRLAYNQRLGDRIEGLRAIHLRGKTRKYVEIPIDEEAALDAIKRFKEIKQCN